MGSFIRVHSYFFVFTRFIDQALCSRRGGTAPGCITGLYYWI